MLQRKWRFIAETLVFACVLIVVCASTAQALSLQSVEGSWSNIVGGKNINFYDDVTTEYGNSLEDQVRWGDPAERYQSGLGFTGVVSGRTFESGDIFEIGQLRHFNHPIYAGSAASAAMLTLNVAFNNPAGVAEMFDFTFAIDETPNSPGPPLSDDIIDFPATALVHSFSIGDADYTFQLLGFGPTADKLINYFQSPEGVTNATQLWGKIEHVPSTVPEPGSLFLLGWGLLGLAGLRKKFRTL